MKQYFPRNWYWYVGGDRTKAFSSASGGYVPASNPTFVAWKSDGTEPTSIDTEANLGAVLAPYATRPSHAGVLEGYLDSQVDDVVIKKLFKIIFQMNNRLRALEGQQPITAAQARAAFRSLL